MKRITLVAAIALAGELGVQVILNPAPAYAVEPDFFRGVSYLVVNETEAQLLLDRLMFLYFIQKKGWLDGQR